MKSRTTYLVETDDNGNWKIDNDGNIWATEMNNKKLSTEWTEAERLEICKQIGTEMLEQVNVEKVMEWAERLIYVSSMPKEFLEANRERML